MHAVAKLKFITFSEWLIKLRFKKNAYEIRCYLILKIAKVCEIL